MHTPSFFLPLLFIFLQACSSAPTVPFNLGASMDVMSKKWQQSVKGSITDVAMAADGQSFLLATLDTDQSYLARWSSSGREIWKTKIKGGIRSIDISKDGKEAVVSSRASGLTLLDEKGQVVWTYEASCEVELLESRKQVLCSILDNPKSPYAFVVLNEMGKLVFTYPATRRVLSYALSRKTGLLVLGLTGGNVAFLDANYRTQFRAQIKGSLMDLAVVENPSDAKEVFIAALSHVTAAPHQSKGVAQWVTLMDDKGRKVADYPLELHYQQIKISYPGPQIVLYGNGIRGQNVLTLALNRVQNRSVLKEQWSYQFPYHGDFASRLLVDGDTFTVGFEGLIRSNTKRLQNYLFEFDMKGNVHWRLNLDSDVKAYAYSVSTVGFPRYKVVGTDTSELQFFGAEKKEIP